jgi:hypothetical protein
MSTQPIVKSVYVIRLTSPVRPSARLFLRSVQKHRITKTSHVALARSFATLEEAETVLRQNAWLTGFKWEIETYMGKGAQ